MTVRTRFAPSPTGALHIGGVRTALFCYLFARRHQGQFILRVEDTDSERSTPESVQLILDAMAWLGLAYDEGPFYQTERMPRYLEVLAQLLREGKAYRCFCSKERLDSLREGQMANKQKPRYDGCCRDLTEVDETQPHVIRFKTPLSGECTVHDAVRGNVVVKNSELDDLILARTDGSPTYNFTVVVDDFDMQVTHVIRGEDHLNNAPRQINIFNALGMAPPSFAHVPMILAPNGKKLSKRDNAASVMDYQAAGYLPEAVLNYLVRLGWSHGDDEIFSMDEMIALFSLEAINKSASAINPEKLDWLNQHYLKTLPLDDIVQRVEPFFSGIDLTGGPDLQAVVSLQRERVKTLKELAEKSAYFYGEVPAYDEKAARKNLKIEAKPILAALLQGFQALPEWEAGALQKVVHDTGEAFEVKLGKVAQPLRVALTGNTISPPIDVTLGLIGREQVIARLQQAIEWIDATEK